MFNSGSSKACYFHNFIKIRKLNIYEKIMENKDLYQLY